MSEEWVKLNAQIRRIEIVNRRLRALIVTSILLVTVFLSVACSWATDHFFGMTGDITAFCALIVLLYFISWIGEKV